MSALRVSDCPRKITLMGSPAGADAVLLRHYFGAGAQGIPLHDVDLHRAQQLQNNKLSILPFSVQEGNTQESPPDLQMMLSQQRHAHLRWQETLALARSLFDSLDVSCVLMKALRSPFALMSDVDFLVPLPGDLAGMARVLEERGFALYRFRLLSHPLKIMAERTEPGERPSVNIDLYPDAMWIRKHVLDGLGVVERRRPRKSRGITVWEPSPEDDLYLVATHAFAHGEIHLAELDHGARILAAKSFSWPYLLEAADEFGCQDALYTYVRLLAATHEAMGCASPVLGDIVDALAAETACQSVARWLDDLGELTLPLRIPVPICTLRSARYHLPAVSRHLSWTELAFDAATHLLTAGTHLLRRD